MQEVTSEQLYEVFRELFGSFMDNPKMVTTAKKANAVVRYSFSNPTVKVTIDAKSEPIAIEYGDCDVTPDVTISMEWKVAHEFLMGRANAADLFMKKKLIVQPMSQATKYLKLIPLFMGLLKRYPDVVKEKGLSDALP